MLGQRKQCTARLSKEQEFGDCKKIEKHLTGRRDGWLRGPLWEQA